MIKVWVMQTIIYLRGLNSQGDDNLRAGGLDFGPMHGPWLKELMRRELPAKAVSDFGAGSVADQTKRAAEIIRSLPEWKDSKAGFHLLGHSTGGLIARALAHELPGRDRILSVTTMATPHRGSPLAAIAKTFPERRPRLHGLLRRVNYDINQRMHSFADLLPDSATLFNRKYPDVNPVVYASVVFSLPVEEMSWPIQIANRLLNEEGILKDHDGYVERRSQEWGRVLAHLPMDHLTQIGFDLSLNPKARRHTRQLFHRLGDILETHWRDLEAGNGARTGVTDPEISLK